MNKKLLAIIICLIIALIATFLGGLQNLIGSPIIGLFIGVLIHNLHPNVSDEFNQGTTFARKNFLSLGIILAGGTLHFGTVVGFGAKAIPLIIFNICISFAVAFFIGKRLNLSTNTSTLVGGGTSICGGTAIATISGIIDAKEDEIAYAMTAIFLVDIITALTYPYLAGLLQLTTNQFSILAGTSINDTSSVAAAEATYNLLNGIDSNLALTVKLARTTMLVVLAIIITAMVIRKQSKDQTGTEVKTESIGKTVLKVFPWFILYFLIMAVLNTMGFFDKINGLPNLLKDGYKYFISAALVGVGFNINFRDLFTKGVKPIILGTFTWLALAISSLTFIYVFADFIG